MSFFHFFIFFIFLLIPQTHSLFFNFTSFPQNTHDIYYQGDAFSTGGSIQVTKNQRDSSLRRSTGRASYAQPVILWDATSGKLTDFTTHFSFIIRAIDPNWCGDGLAFFLAPFDSDIPAQSYGGFLGLFSNNSAFNRSENQIVAVEFDTFQNFWDSSPNHIGINVNSIESVANMTWNNTMKNGTIANAWVSYDSSTKNLSVFLSYAENPVFSGNSSVSYVVDLRKVLPEMVRVGFSAATGDWIEIHTILSWTFNSTLGTISKPKRKIGPTVGVVSGIGFLISGFGLFWIFWWKKRVVLNKKIDTGLDFAISVDFERESGPKRFKFGELSRATKDFSEEGKLGEGGFGGVYKGLLSDSNMEVAVKRVSRGSKQGKKEYVSEVKVISRLRHRNLVQLIGWCHEQGEFLLVYEFLPNGSLDSHLFGTKDSLKWSVRHKIVLGIASALLYLHEEWEQCVIHRDIKSSNVMLDSNYNAKLGDFGLARLIDHELGSQTTVLAGTMGYLAPECVTTGKASKESDVYSFGVVALEIACGRRPIDPKAEPSKVRLVEWVWDLYGNGRILEAADKGLSVVFNEKQIENLMVVGLWCCHPDFNHRPSIKQVVNVLNFEAPLPSLPSKLPVPMYYAPPMHLCRFSFTSSVGFANTERYRTHCSCSSCGSSISAGSSKALL